MPTRRRKSKRSNDESRANGKTVIDFYQTNYGNARYGLAPRSGSALGRLSGKEYVSHARSRPFYRCEDFDELKNFSTKAVLENEVRVKFELFGEKRDVTLRLICDKDCLFGDVKLSDAGSLKAKIKKSLKKAYPSNYDTIFKD